ncbi:response regulator [Micromonospora sp. BRA006-A]|nr:response regulator [Micromonospora sp. BRA006-A]
MLIDEDHRYRRLLGDQLTRFGHLVTEIALHESGRTLSDLTCHTHRRPDVVIVDPVVPAVDGLLLMRLLCVASRRPVLAHSIRGIDDDVVRMLRAGADGFLPKPCPPTVVDACVGALLRRVPPAPPPAPSEVGALRIDVAGRSVTVDGRPVALTRTEFELRLSGGAPRPGGATVAATDEDPRRGSAVGGVPRRLAVPSAAQARRALDRHEIPAHRSGRGVSLRPVPAREQITQTSGSDAAR